MTEQRMRDLPMLDSDREVMRERFGPAFDGWTMDEFKAAHHLAVDEMLDLMNALKDTEERAGP